MTDIAQRAFIQTIRRALGKPSDGGAVPDLFNIPPSDLEDRLARYDQRTNKEKQSLLDELITRGEAVAMEVTVVPDASVAGDMVYDLVLKKPPEWGSEKRIVAWDHPLMEKLQLVDRLGAVNIPLTMTGMAGDQDSPGERSRLRREIEAAYIGITSADFVVAHTATMVMKSRPRQLRSVSLVPSIHVCVVTAGQVLADLAELYTRLQWSPGQKEEGLTNCMTFISAPSKTGDIELVMVNGAHGPREVHLIVIDD